MCFDLSDNSACISMSTRHLTDRQLVRTIMDNSSDTIYFKDLNSAFIMNSKAHAVQFGVESPEQLIGKSDVDFYPPYFANKALEDEQEIMRTGKPLIGRIERLEKENGEVIWFSASKYPLYDDNGNIAGTWGTTRDITALKQAEQELERVNGQLATANAKLKELAIIDELSGLYNRRHFYDILQKTVKSYARLKEKGKLSYFCLLLVDIDVFKRVNDTYGHLAGDAMIRNIAKFLIDHTRSSDYAFRYGGDEFALLLPDCDLAGGHLLANRLRECLQKKTFTYAGIELNLTISVGVACCDGAGDAKDVVHDADTMLYQSKNSGRNCVC
jgi:diguanylate cyclase (GGDEF)-like protein/PAS domain S-box-containing protein